MFTARTALALLLLVPPPARAGEEAALPCDDQPPGDQRARCLESVLDAAYRAIHDATVRTLQQNAERYAEAARRGVASGTASSPRAGLGRADPVTATAIATAAVGTDVKGAKAGATVAPFLLAGKGWDHQLKLTVATLDGGALRAGAGYSWEPGWNPASYADLGFGPCQSTPKELETLNAAVEALRRPFRAVCGALVAELPRTPGPAQAYLAARRACGLVPSPAKAPPVLGLLRARIDAALDAAARAAQEEAALVEAGSPGKNPAALEVQERLARRKSLVRAELEELGGFAPPTVDACHGEDEVTLAFARGSFRHRDVRAGLGTTFEFLPLQWGFQPEVGKPLSHGELVRVEARPEVSLRERRWEASLGVGLAGTREAGGSDFRLVVSPSAGVSYLVGAIGRAPLTDEHGELNAVDGALPPHLSLGLSAAFDWAFRPPAAQATQVQQVELAAFADLCFSKTLSVRIGVPIEAKLATRAKDQPGGARSALQWNVPVSVLAIVKP